MRKIANKKIAALALGAFVMTGTGVAFAYWTTSGSGTGAGATTAGVVNQLTFTQDVLTPMFPGDVSQPLKVTVRNTSPENAYVTGVKAFITTDKAASCDGSNFLLGGVATAVDAASAKVLTWTSVDLAKTTGSADATSTIQFNNKLGNQDPCKSAVVTVNYLAN